MKRAFLVLLLLAVPLAVAEPQQWASHIEAFEVTDKANPPARGGVVFVGSSSIAMWQTLAEDFPSLPVINRGFGGSEIGDSVHYADRIVIPYAPRVVVLYAGENDLASGRTVRSVFAHFKAFVATIRCALPDTRIVYISMKPSPARWALKDKFVHANHLIKAECERLGPQVTYVDVWPLMLNGDGTPRPEQFLADQLHVNRDTYRAWAKLIEPAIN